MLTDRDLQLLEQFLARDALTAHEAAALLALARQPGPTDLRAALLALRPWSDADRTALEQVFAAAPPALSTAGNTPLPLRFPAGADAPAPTIAESGRATSVTVAGPPPRAFGAPTPAPGRPPIAFERYEILHEVARGGMGVVYKARDLRLGRIVALKVLAGGSSASDEMIERFHREARTIAGLHHPRIVPVHDVGEADGACYFTMDFIEGSSLARLISTAAIPRRDGVALLRDVALALHYAHEHGVIHRDVKPGNILVDATGRAFVADFGLAREVESDSRLTASGRPVGTPVYMSPEQAGGEHEALDPRTDVYSLGATLYELLTGRPPYEGDKVMEIIFRVLAGDPPRPSSIDPKVPRDLETIALHAMERDPDRRYPTALALAEDLGRYLEGEAIAARPSGVVYRTWKRARRHPVRATLVATALLVGSAAAAAFGWHAARSTRAARDLADEARAQLAAGRPEHALTLLGRARSADPANAALPVLEDACQAAIRTRDERAREEARLAEIEARNARRARAQPLAEAAQRLLELTDVLARHGEHARRRERLDEAAALLDKAVTEDPDFAEAWFARGRVHRLLGRHEKALADLDRAVALRPTYSAPLIERIGLRADLYHALSSPGILTDGAGGPFSWSFKDLSHHAEAQALLAAAHADLDRVLALGVRPEDAHFVKGTLHVVDGHPGPAIDELTQAIAAFPYFAEAFQKRAFAHLEQNGTDAAYADIQRSIELWPANAEALCYRAIIRVARKEFDPALADFAAAAAIDPELKQASEGRGMVLAAKGDWAAVAEEYTKALAHWGGGLTYVNRGIAYLKLDRLAEARSDFERAVALEPAEPRGWFMRGQLRLVDGDFDGARADIEKAVALAPKEAEMREALGWLFEKRRDWKAAIAAYDAALALAPGEARGLVRRAHAKRESGDLAGALVDLDAALARAPDDVRGRVDRAQLRIARHDLPGALVDIDQALAAAPDNAEARQIRGRLHATAGDDEKALADLDVAVQQEPDEEMHHLYRGMVRLARKRMKDAADDFEAFLRIAPQARQATDVRALLAEARYFEAHADHLAGMEAALTTLAQASERAEQAYERKDWPKAVEEYRAGLRAVADFLAGKDAVLRATVEHRAGAAALQVNGWYNLACCLARQAEAAQGDEREARAREALDALRAAVRLGFSDTAHARNDPDLAAIRGRAEMEEILKSAGESEQGQ